MKTLIFLITFVSVAFSQSQITELEETRLSYNPVSFKSANSFEVTVLENYAGEFENDPLAFMKNNLDVKRLISQLPSEEYESYLVSIQNRKGEFHAVFDESGKLLNTNQRFVNIVLPMEICHQLYREHTGWAIVKNVHIARSKNGIINKDFYRITMRNGKEKKNLTIDARENINTSMASNK